MTTIWQRVTDALSGLGIPVHNARLIAEAAELPEKYITFQVIAAAPEDFVDDREISRNHLVQLNMWSTPGFESFPDVEAAMSAAGFAFQAERDMDRAETGHYGQSKDFLFVEDKEQE